MYIRLVVLLSLFSAACATKRDLAELADSMDHKVARVQYLHECDWCDVAFKPGSEGHQNCIITATKRWLNIKQRRGWK